MSLILCTENDIILASGLKFRVISKTSLKESMCYSKIDVELPAAIPFKKNVDNPTEPEKPYQEDPSKSSILGGGIASDYSLMALIDSRKQVTLWSCSDWKLVQQWALPRRPIKTVFSPDGSKLLVADKGGDVISLDVTSSEDGVCLLGHLSMLLDLAFSSCGKFVITCDRDEKIRVSRYPNSYNINNFCLGHSEFVTGLCLCPHQLNIMISTSGDGTIKTWKYLEGLELHSQACSDHLENEIKSQGDKVPAVTNIKCAGIDNDSSFVVVTVNGFDGFLLFKTSGPDGKLEFKQRILTKGPVRDLAFDCSTSSEIKLFVLAPAEEGRLLGYQASGEQLVQIDFAWGLEDKENLVRFFDNACNAPAFSTDELYKKWFDNMAEYMQKKEQRIFKSKCKKTVGDLDSVEQEGDDDVCVKRIKI